MDNVFVENLVLIGKHGVGDHERETPREFHIEISAEVDTKTAIASDDIDDAANYKDFVAIAREIFEGPSCRLIEVLADKIATRILENPRVKTVSVTVRKPKALPLGTPGVTIVRPR
ncbi:dihydroneopterin aldolase [Candidatus Kaiserbacteria bacterium RIFCSPHIGHO2_02_FULL_59_21]|uniref:7,8-dihydroneopterin aldolase n=2 Tax=Candidatus Kaiseribacteriota TaxID=1752734 RepID=A0A0G1YXG8_9BACT|nr:MAG: Dihydroneopterin aldolase [Candidatus Kaiserbacteria bacterium GW2011_GWA2_58_9]OGG61687.1 MAG: dihydroneopterin aldolase [Candidatus Kaiserbacteria bacterium RIFCSPHIGHO2_01_FULL_58_22]OGG66931.1 MAG: dihydroneopterin aldolase [Candidatus Kaiserbacteria bacterium RIFCSPHIGHO2_02_FULL_59_21]OGG80456.1 MAG: dihydroneopterin aldolase [Candidatus Kaiserbacteria bacterium RIFCSPLOWO2_01_FULL_59_34]OGG86268.1 MAG: dihydroneopterin aldolase [Candidatus Kaiserbacteria bacterium RIFCSPLOWO2_02_